ncbi:hypothetical protein ACZ90_06390 [Streptomyces albus subsp. albus]|nr:hypothetical protein ACZ90_06390 [Streptomyces albus subsp. albus]
MTRPADGPARTVYAEAAATLALRVLDALRGVEDTAMLADFVERGPDPKAALAAVRVIGADTLAPRALLGGLLHPQDAAAVSQAATLFPAPVHAPAPPDGPAENWVVAWRDWGTARLLARHGGTAPEVPEPPAGPALTDAGPWQRWAVTMAQLAPLSLPGVDGPVREAALRNPLALARGTTRALLRRDYPTAARLLRWLAALHAAAVPLPLDPATVLDHLELRTGDGPRLALDLAVARALLGPRTREDDV